MATKKSAAATPNNAGAVTVRYDAESIANIALKVKVEGFVPADHLREEFGNEKFTRGIAVLYRDFRMFREVRRQWKDDQGVIGYEWADQRFSRSEVKKIPTELGFLVDLTTPLAPKYSDFQRIVVHCRYTTAVLGGCPVDMGKVGTVNCFERDCEGHILILRYNLRAMAASALARLGKMQSIARHIGFETIRILPNGNLSHVDRPVVDGGVGKGITRSERLADGTEFTIAAMVPTSMLSIAEYLAMLRIAGTTVGLSPGRSAGFGDFDVLEAE